MAKAELLSTEEIRQKLRDFQDKYEHASGCMDQAFRGENGTLHETDDFHEWSLYYAAFRTINKDHTFCPCCVGRQDELHHSDCLKLMKEER